MANDNKLTTNAISLLANNNLFGGNNNTKNEKRNRNKNFSGRVSVIVAGGEPSKLKKIVNKRNSLLIKNINNRRRSSVRLFTQVNIGDKKNTNTMVKSLYNNNNSSGDRPKSFDVNDFNNKIIEDNNKISAFSPKKKSEKIEFNNDNEDNKDDNNNILIENKEEEKKEEEKKEEEKKEEEKKEEEKKEEEKKDNEKKEEEKKE
jgi:hypothetical protein